MPSLRYLVAFISLLIWLPGLAAGQELRSEVVFHHASQACETWDIPDMAARAFRDADDKIHLVATHFVNRALVGPSFDSLRKACDPIYVAGNRKNPAEFDDQGWLESFYTPDGKTVYALTSMDYHPGRHREPCSAGADGCWYSAITWAVSRDGGARFQSPPAPQRFVAGSLNKFGSTQDHPVGAFVPSNIIFWEGYYYTMISFGGDGGQLAGECVFRTGDLSDPGAWRAWDGVGYNVAFASPYSEIDNRRTRGGRVNPLGREN